MDRRQFLTITTLGGLGVVAAIGLRKDGAPPPAEVPAEVPAEAFGGTIFVHVHAGGGWDPASLCDPKAAAQGDPRQTWYAAETIEQCGDLRYAPLRDRDGRNVGREFFQKHGERLLILNGIDTSTSLHDSGDRYIGCGSLDEGYPSFGALYAATVARQLPIAYLSFGAYDETIGLVTRTRSGFTNALAQLGPNDAVGDASPSALENSSPEPKRSGADPSEYPRVDPSRLSKARAALGSRFVQTSKHARFDDLRHYLPGHLDTSDNPLIRQAQVAMASARAGITSACNLYIGGFDTYERHDDTHVPRLIQLIEGIDFLWEEAGRQGIQDRLVISCGSSCGRAPQYNERQGKDDWPVTSMLFMGRGIRGNRVIGATDEGGFPLRINPSTLELDSTGVLLAPRHIHRSLRRLAGIESHELSARFPLDVPATEDLQLFG